VRQHAKETIAKPGSVPVFMDPKVRKRVKVEVHKVDKSHWRKMVHVSIPRVSVDREKYSVNLEEFRPVKILRRVYKPTSRKRRHYVEILDEGIGIGGYVVRFADGHDWAVFPFMRKINEVPH
jgi:hypothetical protein